ncbi:hypothetical protein [Curtobacterium sp. MCBA15_001]|uniref:hypothetical protein n=1 Tax=Curtobacterium sp. MCBA15_001 TaxID=1898731 RepID=UPI0008DE7CC8|nr:hypothetical protein [Curtobacterium sp. MCBA15_001]OIH92415.1 hypothetical protein BIU90_11010 [Curtobacterium sp. MCBA15_001]
MHVSENIDPSRTHARIIETAERMRRRAPEVTAFELADPMAVGIVVEMPVGEDASGWYGDPYAWTEYWDGLRPTQDRPATTTIATYSANDLDVERRLGFDSDAASGPEVGAVDVEGTLVPLRRGAGAALFARCQIAGDVVLVRTRSDQRLVLRRVASFDALIANTLEWFVSGATSPA